MQSSTDSRTRLRAGVSRRIAEYPVPTRRPRRFLPILTLVCGLILLASGVRYGTRHAFPIGWDEPMYVNQIRFDRDTLLAKGPLVFARKQLGTERWRPPAYRLAAAPITLAAPPTAPVLRMLALASLVVAALLLFLAGREVAGNTVGVLWAAAFGMAAGPFEADLLFGTEVPLYPALAGMLLAIARWYRRGEADRGTAVLLLFSAAVGAISKLSFLVVFLPTMLAALVFAPGSNERLRHQVRIAVAAGLGLLVISPWWIYNWREAVHYANYASDFVRGYEPWLSTAATKLLGWPLTLGVLATAAWGLASVKTIRHANDRPVRNLLIVLLVGSLPLLALHLMSDNHLMRLLTPAWATAAGAVPMILYLTNALERRAVPIAVAALIVAQCLILSVDTWRQTEKQTDWNHLRELTRHRGVSNPTVMQLGLGAAFNPPQIMYAWMSRGEPIRAKWLWRWEHGPIDWPLVHRRIDSADVVVTSFNVGRGATHNDNMYNRTLAQQLSTQGSWIVDTLPFAESGGPTILVFSRKH